MFPRSFQKVYRKLPLPPLGRRGLQEVSSLFPSDRAPVRQQRSSNRKLRPVVEHKGIGGHAPAEARASARCFKRLWWQTKSRVRPTFVSHLAEAGLDFGRFQKILERFRKVSVSSRTLAPARSMFGNVSESFNQGVRPPQPNSSENPVVEHKEIDRHDARVSGVSAAH